MPEYLRVFLDSREPGRDLQDQGFIHQKLRIQGFFMIVERDPCWGLELLHPAESSCARYSPSRPALTLGPACAQVVRELGVIHLCVTTLTKFWVISPELLVPLVQEIDLRIVEPWIDIFVNVPIFGPQLRAVIRPPLA